MKARWLRFLIVILVGVGIGLAYGWVVNPVEYVDTSPDTLRSDYKADYVLMVAEAYDRDGDLYLAVRRLALLGELPLSDVVFRSLIFAQKVGYTDEDLSLMQQLLSALQAFDLSQETPAP